MDLFGYPTPSPALLTAADTCICARVNSPQREPLAAFGARGASRVRADSATHTVSGDVRYCHEPISDS